MPVERETIITDGGDNSGAGMAAIIAALIIVLLLVGGITVYNGGFSIGGGTVDVPKITVSK